MLTTQEILEQLGNPNNTKNPATKLNDFINYLANNYSENQNEGISVEEAIYVAKKTIVEDVIKNREKEGLGKKDGNLLCTNSVYGAKGNWTMGFFIRHPKAAVQYLLVQGKQQALRKGDQELANKFQVVAEKVHSDKNAYTLFELYSNKIHHENDMINLSTKYNRPNTVDSVFNANKPSFLNWLFRRTSKEYKNFEKEFKAYKDGTKIGQGDNARDADRASVKRSAVAYLRHKLPGYDGENLPSLEQINQLRGKSKSRALFCYNVLKSTKESEEFEKNDTELKQVVENQMKSDGTNNATNKIYEADSIDPVKIQSVLNDFSPKENFFGSPTVLTDSQKTFQKSLSKDLEDKPTGVDVQKLSKHMAVAEVEYDDPDMSMGN